MEKAEWRLNLNTPNIEPSNVNRFEVGSSLTYLTLVLHQVI